jgi:RNA polymerase sigma factor (sigma-70 family)
MPPTRHTLIKQLQTQHDQSAWETFVATYEAYIYVVLTRAGASHDEAVDLRQDILIKIWKALPEFDYQPGKAKFRTWLCQVIHNTSYNYFSSRSSEQSRVTNYFAHKDDKAPSLMDNIMEEEWRNYLSNLALKRVEDVSNAQNIAIFKRMLAGDTAQQLADEFGLKENSIHRVKNRVRDKLIIEISKLRQDLE